MSITDAFDKEGEELLQAKNMIKREEDFPETVVVTFIEPIFELARQMEGAVQIGTLNAGCTLPIYQVNYKGRNIAVYRTMIGGAASAALLEEVIAKGGRKFVFFGSCGTLNKELAAGHLIVPTSAYRDEGTSYHYAPAGDYIEIATADRLAEVLSELNLPYIKGKTWTTDAIYRETRRNMLARKQDGCITVEMECASIMAAGQFRNAEVYQYLYTEDNLDGDIWEPRTMGNVPQSAFEQYLRIALEIAARV